MTNTSEKIAPVTNWENEKSLYLGLCHEDGFQEALDYAKSLRERQAAYHASLPRDPSDALRGALEMMHPDGEEYLDGFEEALHLSVALEALVETGVSKEDPMRHPAARYISSRMVESLARAQMTLDRISDILGNPKRVERDR